MINLSLRVCFPRDELAQVYTYRKGYSLNSVSVGLDSVLTTTVVWLMLLLKEKYVNENN